MKPKPRMVERARTEGQEGRNGPEAGPSKDAGKKRAREVPEVVSTNSDTSG